MPSAVSVNLGGSAAGATGLESWRGTSSWLGAIFLILSSGFSRALEEGVPRGEGLGDFFFS